jgi:hypothetical protein
VEADVPIYATSSVITTSSSLWPDSVTAVTCRGPNQNPYVLPVLTDSNQGNLLATSLCNGTNMNQTWFVHNVVVQIPSGHPLYAQPTAFSWLYVPELPTAATMNNFGMMMFTPPKPKPRLISKTLRAGRRAVRRSVDLYARFRGYDEARRFIKGEEIIYRGLRFDYHVQKRLQVLSQTMQPGHSHIPYQLSIYNKAGKRLAAGCIVFPGLPLFDQLLALSFHIEDPDEELKLLKTTNWNPRLPRNFEALPSPSLTRMAA